MKIIRYNENGVDFVREHESGMELIAIEHQNGSLTL
jgi:hypothetical protein